MSPDFNILYVNDTAVSAQFYADLLDKQPMEGSPTFTMFQLSNEMLLGLWSTQAVEPKSLVKGGGSEVGFTVDSRKEVDDLHANWQQRGISIAQSPTHMSFGYTFVALDPDGHRLRVFSPKEND